MPDDGARIIGVGIEMPDFFVLDDNHKSLGLGSKRGGGKEAAPGDF